jgi:sensor histidine kinase regulating citrate/malate metabolism
MTDQVMPGRIARAVAAFAIAMLVSGLSAPLAAQAKPKTTTKPQAGEIFAQKLVTEMRAEHPEADELGIMTMTRRGCVGIASTDKADVGEKCEADDSAPMRTGKPQVGKEEGGYAVSLPLHDSAGKVIGAVAIEFRAAKDRTKASATEEARKIERAMAAKLSSKAKLFERSR